MARGASILRVSWREAFQRRHAARASILMEERASIKLRPIRADLDEPANWVAGSKTAADWLKAVMGHGVRGRTAAGEGREGFETRRSPASVFAASRADK